VALPEELVRFIRERLPSAEQIEIVLLLRRDAARTWSASEVSENLGTPPESTAMRLFLLTSNGILGFEGARYRYAADAATEEMVRALAEAYDVDREALFTIVGTPARDPLRSFADAFKLKR
jgi:hypothetical protein